MTCLHDPLYRINNEAAGGAGCPICNAQRTRRVVAVGRIGGGQNVITVDPDFSAAWFNREVISERLAQTEPDVDLLDMRDITGKWVLPDDELTAMRKAAQRGIDNGGFMGHED